MLVEVGKLTPQQTAQRRLKILPKDWSANIDTYSEKLEETGEQQQQKKHNNWTVG